MLSMFKTMDNNTIKSMMKMQGMDITDEQIHMMKNSMNPEMLKMMGQNANFPINNQKTDSSNNNSTSVSSNNPTPQLPNMDMSAMMKIIQSNPDLIKSMAPQLAGMFGNNGNPEMMAKAMENVLWLVTLPQRTKQFVTSRQGLLVIAIILGLLIAYFYR